MWCAQCQADVATEVSADGRTLLCTTCGNQVRQVFSPSLHPETQMARELLKRWQEEDSEPKPTPPDPKRSAQDSAVTDSVPQPVDTLVHGDRSNQHSPVDTLVHGDRSNQHQPVVDTPSSSAVQADPVTEADAPPATSTENSAPPGRTKTFRIDREHAASGPKPSRRTTAPSRSKEVERTPTFEEARKAQRRIDQGHTVKATAHFEPQPHPPTPRIPAGRTEVLWGQLLAYGGVGTMTIGTVLVLWGYFGKVETYASTGWLVATAGQMLLLLGIVTLIGGGMQQTTHEVSQQIESLGGRIVRIENSTNKLLKGPNFNRSRTRKRRRSQTDRGNTRGSTE